MSRSVFSIRLDPTIRAALDTLAETLGIGPSQLAADLVALSVRDLTAHAEQLSSAVATIKAAGGHIQYQGRAAPNAPTTDA